MARRAPVPKFVPFDFEKQPLRFRTWSVPAIAWRVALFAAVAVPIGVLTSGRVRIGFAAVWVTAVALFASSVWNDRLHH